MSGKKRVEAEVEYKYAMRISWCVTSTPTRSNSIVCQHQLYDRVWWRTRATQTYNFSTIKFRLEYVFRDEIIKAINLCSISDLLDGPRDDEEDGEVPLTNSKSCFNKNHVPG